MLRLQVENGRFAIVPWFPCVNSAGTQAVGQPSYVSSIPSAANDLDESMQEPVFQVAEVCRSLQLLENGSPPQHDADTIAWRRLNQGFAAFLDSQ